MRHACIVGRGLAASCIATQLVARGWSVSLKAGPPIPRSSAIEVDRTTFELLHELMPELHPAPAKSLLLEGRLVRWGRQGDFTFVPGESHSLCLGTLSCANEEMVRPGVPAEGTPPDISAASSPCDHWVVNTCAGSDGDCGYDQWGSRRIVQARLTLAGSMGRPISIMIGRPDGWLYLLPVSPASVSAQLAFPASALERHTPQDMLERALGDAKIPWLAGQRQSEEVRVHCGAPRLARRPFSRRSIAIGGAAARFDPLCSQGLGAALRMSVLAAASLEAAEAGSSPRSVLDHYRGRLLRHFAAHLQHCAKLYALADLDHSWQEELRQIAQGASVMSMTLREASPEQFRLEFGRLKPLRHQQCVATG